MSAKNTHIPGPWKVSERTPDNKGYAAYALDIDQERGFITSVASVWCGEEIPDKTESANAKLIAAAPELLEALERLITWVDPVKFPDAILDAKEVIKKATT